MRIRPRGSQDGLTLLESVISVSLITMIVGIFSWSVNDALESGTSIAGSAGQRERGRRALTRIKRELATIGRMDDLALGVNLPIVFSDGAAPAPFDGMGFDHDAAALAAQIQGFPAPPAAAPQGAVPAPFVAPQVENAPSAIREIVFRAPMDVDGDGTIFDGATGTLEWSNEVIGYLMIPDGRGGFDLVRRSVFPDGTTTDEVLVRGVEAVTFDLQETRGILPLQAIEIHLHLISRDSRGRTHRAQLATTVTMRNSQ